MPEITSAIEIAHWKQVTKTITFTGAAGAGEVGTVTVFTVAGRVFVNRITAYCTTLLDEALATATIALGTAGDTDGFIGATNAVDLDALEWWTAASPVVGSKSPLKVETGGLVTGQIDKMVSEDIIITVGAQNVDAGVIVFDVWYDPITSGGSLS
ncbi:MAG: hypothetical protein U0990_12665 [Candidatus Nanopelagicales bacterium]|nr:hypothetical protein [Candidatus Nanopelagicales bacterium]